MALSINNLLCIGCGECRTVCVRNAVQEHDYAYSIDQELCVECGDCKKTCCRDAIGDLCSVT